VALQATWQSHYYWAVASYFALIGEMPFKGAKPELELTDYGKHFSHILPPALHHIKHGHIQRALRCPPPRFNQRYWTSSRWMATYAQAVSKGTKFTATVQRRSALPDPCSSRDTRLMGSAIAAHALITSLLLSFALCVWRVKSLLSSVLQIEVPVFAYAFGPSLWLLSLRLIGFPISWLSVAHLCA
jgi:hypothetical protein